MNSQQIINLMQNKPELMQRAQQMLQGKSDEEKAQIITNVCQQCGIDFNQAFQEFQNNMNMFQQLFGGMNR